MVGLEEIKRKLGEWIENKEAYKRCRVSIPNFLIDIERHNGYSYIQRYIAYTLANNDLREFTGLDLSVEYKLDGSYRQLEDIINDINYNIPVYENKYKGVVAVDITELANYLNEEQVDYFFDAINAISENATVITFVDTSGAKEKLLFDMASKRLENIDIYHIGRYSYFDLARIAYERIQDKGIIADDKDYFLNVLSVLAMQMNIEVAADTFCLVDRIALAADYSGYNPKITKDIVRGFISFDDTEKGAYHER
ncbi:MAG: hypothetical protein IJV15_06375 [Lachnospiraceae bacterium]|nr:hypothetical protein [Lachnospiraceae bacterium]